VLELITFKGEIKLEFEKKIKLEVGKKWEEKI